MMKNLLLAYAQILVVSVWVVLAWLGWGRAVARWCRIGATPAERSWNRLWLGWATVVALLQLWHLFGPLDIFASLCVYGLGVLLAVRQWRRARMLIQRNWRQAASLRTLFLLLVAVWVAGKTMLAPTHYDSGFYYLHTLRWLNECEVVPGLGNLNPKLAYNQTQFLYAASLNFFPWVAHGYRLANGLLFLLVFADCWQSLIRWSLGWRTKSPARNEADFLPGLFVPVLGWFVLPSHLSSAAPDEAIFVLQIALFVHCWRLLTGRCWRRQTLSRIRWLLLLGTVAVSVKFSTVWFAGLVMMGGLVVSYRASGLTLHSFSRRMRTPFFLAMSFLFVWMVRGWMQSGYPFFPAPYFRLPLAWAVPLAEAQTEANWVYSWARRPYADWQEVLGNWHWVRDWASRVWQLKMQAVYPLGLAFLLGLAGVWCWRTERKPGTRLDWAAVWFLIGPVAGALVCWFFVVPDYRFAAALFWMFPVAVTGAVWHHLQSLRAKRKLELISLICLAAICGSWLAGNLSLLRGLSRSGWQSVRVAELRQAGTLSGKPVYLPVKGDQIWAAPLLTAPAYHPALRLRGTEVCRGFVRE